MNRKCIQNESKFIGVYSRNKQKVVVNVVNLDEHKSIKIHWIVWDMNGNNVMYFDNFRDKRIQKEI